jgi:hypothetical protein
MIENSQHHMHLTVWISSYSIYIGCVFLFSQHIHRSPLILCHTVPRFLARNLGERKTTVIIHYMFYQQRLLYIIRSINSGYYTLYVVSTLVIIHYMFYQQRLLYIICSINNGYYTLYVLSTMVIIHYMFYISLLLIWA